jgi:glycerophosphoryl diester phosphodiesterase
MAVPTTPITFAHRGARTVEPENTVAAFARALELGASGLETDAWVSEDGEVVLVHGGRIRAGLRRRSVGRSSAAALARRGIPRLAEVYRELGADFELSVDLKDRRAGRIAIDVARAQGDPERLWLCTPSVELIHELRAEARDVRLVHSTGRIGVVPAIERHAADLAQLGADAMNLHHSDWSAGLVTLFHRFGLLAFAWDAQQERHLRDALERGVDAVYCDDVARMVSVVQAWMAEQR